MENVSGKSERFIRIAENRTNKILDDLRLLGNCANRSIYEYSEEDVKKIFLIIEQELKKIKSKFTDVERKNKFKL